MTGVPTHDLQARALCRRFGRRVAVEAVDLCVEAGQVCGILGGVGAGKTTLLALLSGVLAPDAGEVRFRGRSMADPLWRARCVGSVVGAPAGYPFLSARENLWVLAQAGELSIPPERVEEHLTEVGLLSHAGEQVGRWPLALRQRLSLAQATLGRPSLILLDEPTRGLDASGRETLRRVLERHTQRGATVVLTTEHAADLEELCTQRLHLDRGRSAFSGPVPKPEPVEAR